MNGKRDDGSDTPSDIIARAFGARGARGGAIARRGADIAPRPGDGADIVPHMIQLPPPELAVYPDAVPLYQEGRAAAVATGASATLCAYELAPGQCAVVNSFLAGAVNLTTGMQIKYALRINGAPWPGMTRSLPQQNAAAGFITWGPDEVLIWVPSGALIEVVATVVAGGPVDLSAQFAGWEYPQAVRDRYLQVWRG